MILECNSEEEDERVLGKRRPWQRPITDSDSEGDDAAEGSSLVSSILFGVRCV